MGTLMLESRGDSLESSRDAGAHSRSSSCSSNNRRCSPSTAASNQMPATNREGLQSRLYGVVACIEENDAAIQRRRGGSNKSKGLEVSRPECSDQRNSTTRCKLGSAAEDSWENLHPDNSNDRYNPVEGKELKRNEQSGRRASQQFDACRYCRFSNSRRFFRSRFRPGGFTPQRIVRKVPDGCVFCSRKVAACDACKARASQQHRLDSPVTVESGRRINAHLNTQLNASSPNAEVSHSVPDTEANAVVPAFVGAVPILTQKLSAAIETLLRVCAVAVALGISIKVRSGGSGNS